MDFLHLILFVQSFFPLFSFSFFLSASNHYFVFTRVVRFQIPDLSLLFILLSLTVLKLVVLGCPVSDVELILFLE